MTFYAPTERRRGGYIQGRDPLVDEVMRGWQRRYCTFSDVSLCISTYNVNGRSPPDRLQGWFPGEAVADLYVVGLQEMDLSVGTYIIDNTRKMFEWVQTIHNSLPGGKDNFKLIKSVRLVGIFIVLFKHNNSKVDCSHVQENFIATGISVLGNKLGNKGGTAISLKLNDTLACFVNCHLAAGDRELERRNQDYRDISQLLFVNGLNIHDHDVVFWFGDLNYRINAEDMGLFGDQVREIASGKDYRTLLKYDQLREQQSLGRVFVGFQEPEVLDFRPTYKYDPGTRETWDTSEKARAPAWCDRILWWSKDSDLSIKQHLYNSVPDIKISDHKPVRAVFSFVVKHVDQKKADALHEDAIREADRRSNELLPQITLSETEVEFGEVKYLQPISKGITITNVGKSRVKFKFMVRPQGEAFAKWLQVTPPHYVIPVGQSTKISLTVTIDQDIVGSLEESNLQDILVMNLENGRDHFIPVTAKYYPKCFGVTLERLLENKGKKAENLIDFGEPTTIMDLSPPHLPKEIFRLVIALQERGTRTLRIDRDNLTTANFFIVRDALEEDSQKDLADLSVSTFDIYNALLRLLESLKEPVIPRNLQRAMKEAANDPGRLWAIVDRFPRVNSTTFEYLITYLTELVRSMSMADELLSSWADLLFRDRDQSSDGSGNGYSQALMSVDPRVIALRSCCSYSKDVSICHANSTSRLGL